MAWSMPPQSDVCTMYGVLVRHSGTPPLVAEEQSLPLTLFRSFPEQFSLLGMVGQLWTNKFRCSLALGLGQPGSELSVPLP